MKFLLVNIACINGGVEAHFGLLAHELARRGHSVDAYFYIDGGSEYASGKHLFDGVCRYWIGPGVSLSEVLAAGRYDVVHTNLRALEWGIVNTLSRVGYSGIAVATSHGDVIPGWPSEDGRFALTAVSNHLADRLREAGYTDAAVVHNAVDLSVFNDSGPVRPASRPVVVWVGRSCDADKDFTGMAAAAYQLADRGYLLWIVDGRTERGLNTLDCWLPESCEILRGLTPSEMAAVYRGAAASGGFLLSTSQNEAFGLALCEAMACGCPVVAPRVGGIPEVVEDGVSGVLYDRAGGVKDLFDKAGLLSDPDFRASIVAGGLERVRRMFAAPIMIDGYERVYEAAVSASKPGKPSCRQRAFAAAVRIRRLLRGCLERGHRPT